MPFIASVASPSVSRFPQKSSPKRARSRGVENMSPAPRRAVPTALLGPQLTKPYGFPPMCGRAAPTFGPQPVSVMFIGSRSSDCTNVFQATPVARSAAIVMRVKPEFEYEKLPTVVGGSRPCTAVSGVTFAFWFLLSQPIRESLSVSQSLIPDRCKSSCAMVTSGFTSASGTSSEARVLSGKIPQ